MKKKNSYFIYVELSVIILAFLAYTKLLYPNEMLQMMDLTFDQYNTSGVMWSYWKAISDITRILVLIAGVINLYVIIGGFGKKTGRGVTAAISVDIVYAVWILLMTIAEKSTAVLTALLKIFSGVCGVTYYADGDYASCMESVDYFTSRIFVLAFIIIMLVCAVCCRNKVQDAISHKKEILYIIFAGLIHLLFDVSTESRALYHLLGISDDKWTYLASIRADKIGMIFALGIPIVFIVICVVITLFHDKIPKTRIIPCSLLIEAISMICMVIAILVRISNNIKDAKASNVLYYSGTVKQVLLLENAGLFVFECVSIIILVNLVRDKMTFSKAMILQLVITLVSFGLMRVIADMELWGVVIGVSSLVVLVLWLILSSLSSKKE